MRIPRLYSSQPLFPEQTIVLDEKASRYLVTVLRMQQGRALSVFDGLGGEYSATLVNADKKRAQVYLEKHVDINRESPLQIELGIGISRGDRMDWVIQKATELGATKITPLMTERTEVKLKGERQEKKQDHWLQVAISACEQCQRNQLPIITPPAGLTDWISSSKADKKLVLHHRTDERLSSGDDVSSCCLLIGPEGGLSDSEINLALDNGFQALALGPRVLRTETAPVSALSILQFLWGDV